jgi:hypothetical protein
MTRPDACGNVVKPGLKSIDFSNPKVIRLLENDILVANVFWPDKIKGTGWRLISYSPNWPSSRMAWPSAYDAVRSAFGSETAKLFVGY